MAEVIIKIVDKEGSEVGLTFEFEPEIDADAVGMELTGAQHLAIVAINAITDEIEK